MLSFKLRTLLIVLAVNFADLLGLRQKSRRSAVVITRASRFGGRYPDISCLFSDWFKEADRNDLARYLRHFKFMDIEDLEFATESRGKAQCTVEFMDGPAEGKRQEMGGDWHAPDDIGIRDDAEQSLMHWYRVFGDKAYFDHSERDKAYSK